jgi:hypothetical protein
VSGGGLVGAGVEAIEGGAAEAGVVGEEEGAEVSVDGVEVGDEGGGEGAAAVDLLVEGVEGGEVGGVEAVGEVDGRGRSRRSRVGVEVHVDGVGAASSSPQRGHGRQLAGEDGDEAGAGAQLEVADGQHDEAGRGRPPSAGSWVQARWVLATQSGRAP